MKEKKQKKAVDEAKQPLMAHLLALRSTLVYCVVAIIVGFVVAFYLLCDPVMAFITEPVHARDVTIIYTAASEALTTQLKVSLLVGIVIVSPFIFYQIWRFIKPALFENEIRAFRPLFFLAMLLFIAGVFFSYFFVYELAIDFFLASGENLATPLFSISKYVSFLLGFLLPFGVVFEMPVAIYIASRKGWVSYRQLAKNRKFVLFGIFILAAVLTPPDVISQVMLGAPMYVLYEISVQISRFVKPRSAEVIPAEKVK